MLYLHFQADQMFIAVGIDTAVGSNTQLGPYGKISCVLGDFRNQGNVAKKSSGVNPKQRKKQMKESFKIIAP